MIKKENSIASIPTGQNITNKVYYVQGTNKAINNVQNVNYIKKKGKNKKVTFNKDIAIYDVESYKAHNKLFCYNENEDIDGLYRNNDEFNKKYNKFLNKFKNNNNNNMEQQKTNKEEDCCCFII